MNPATAHDKLLLVPDIYLNRLGQPVLVSEQEIAEGIVELVASGPGLLDTGMIDDETGETVFTNLLEGELVIASGGRLVICRQLSPEVQAMLGSTNITPEQAQAVLLNFTANQRSSSQIAEQSGTANKSQEKW